MTHSTSWVNPVFALRFFIASIIVAVAITGCSSDAPEEVGLMEYVPADSPYVMAVLEPMPDDVLDNLEPKVDVLLASYRDFMKIIPEMAAARAAENPESSQIPEEVMPVLEELSGILSIEGLRQAGIDRESTMALYGVGLLPVMRMTLSDGQLFEDTLVRVEQKAAKSMSTAMIEGQTYRYAGDEKARLVIAVIGNDLVVSVVPTALSEASLKSVLGLTLPESSMADSGAIDALMAKYDFTANMLFLVDMQRLAASFLDTPSSVTAELLGMLDFDSTQLSDVCKSEYRAMAGIAPRLVAGYTEMNVERLVTNTIFELRSDLATGLAGLVAPVPGLGSEQPGLMAFGMSVNIPAAQEFYNSRVEAMMAEPYECEQLAWLQQGALLGGAALQQPLPPGVDGIRGFLGVLEDIKGMDLANDQPPTSADFRLLVAADDAPALLAMGAMFSPEIAALDLQPDGQPVAFETQQLGPMVQSAFVALTDTTLGIAVGQGTDARLVEMMMADVNQPHPFMSMEFDMAGYYDFLASAALMNTNGDEEIPLELREAMSKMMRASADLYSRMSMDVEFTERGIEMPSDVELSDK